MGPNSSKILEKSAIRPLSYSLVQFLLFSENSLYSGVCPHCSLAFFEYSSSLLLSNAVKSNLLTPLALRYLHRLSRFSMCSFLSSRRPICCSSAFFLSKSDLFIISFMSLSGNSSSLNSKICCNFSSAASSYSL